MYKYILKRLVLLIPVIIGVSLLVFSIMDIAEGDPVYQIVSETASEEVIEATREAYGLNDPFLVRYARYMINLCKGSMGTSYITKQDVFKTYMELLPNTVKLSLLAVVIAIVVSIPLGINAAIHQNTWADTGSMFTSLLFVSMPQFWLGLLLMLAFALKLGWFPSGGNEDGLKSLILPVFTVGIGLAALMTRTTRSSMLETIRQDYITTAKAKGVSNKNAIYHHAFKNALIPIVTVGGMQLAQVLGGSVLAETVFSYPGVGRLIVQSIERRDIPMVTGALILTTIIVSVVNLATDIVYAFIDPRIKSQYARK